MRMGAAVFCLIQALFILVISSTSFAVRIDYTYDARNRLQQAQYADGTAFTFTLDAANNRTSASKALGADSDGDGLSDSLEAFLQTNPGNPDSDGDGLLDGQEDANQDGVLDGETDPNSGDTDMDGMGDKYEVDYGLDALFDDAALDPDMDGFTNLQEAQGGSDPFDENSTPAAVAPVPALDTFGMLAAIGLLLALGWMMNNKHRYFVFMAMVGLSALLATPANAALPGWKRISAKPVAPSSREEMLARPAATDVSPLALNSFGPTLMGLAPDASDPEIIAQANALSNDLDLIYQYVHDTIAYEPYYGMKKGALGTMLDKSGNSWDQSALMVALVRAGGGTARLMYGEIQIDGADATNWLGIENQCYPAGRLVSNTGFQGAFAYGCNGDGTLWLLQKEHVWVEVTIGGSPYVFDPAYKANTVHSGSVDVPTAMGYSQPAMTAAAAVTSDGTTLSAISRSGIQSKLTEYATNLATAIRAQDSSATLAELVGGVSAIVPYTGAPLRQASLPYEFTTPTPWQNVPDTQRTKLTLTHSGISNHELFTDEIYGRRLTIFYDGSSQPVLRLDGTVLATGTPLSSSGDFLYVSISHPYPGTFGDISNQVIYLVPSQSYAIVSGWAHLGSGVIDKHRERLDGYLDNSSLSATSEEVLGETLAMLGAHYMAQDAASDKLSEAVTGMKTVQHHIVGVISQADSVAVDLPIGLTSPVDLNDPAFQPSGSSADSVAAFYTSSGRGSVYESGVIEQTQGFGALSTVEIFDYELETGLPVFYNLDDPADISLLDSSYTSATEANILAYLNAGYRVVLPQNGGVTRGVWSGAGYLVISPDESNIAHLISGGFKGGYGSLTTLANASSASLVNMDGESIGTSSSEPIDLATGAYYYLTGDDLSLGRAEFKNYLGFRRFYSVGDRHKGGLFGRGWSTIYDATATVNSNGLECLGQGSPEHAASAMAAMYVAHDLLKSSKSLGNVVISKIIEAWYMEQLTDNVVTVSEPGRSELFVKRADGTYAPPTGSADQLAKPSGFVVTTADGLQKHYDATTGRLSQIVDTNGLAITSTLPDGCPGACTDGTYTVSDSFGKALTFTVSSGRVSQVADGTGRSVSYQYDADGNLTSYTDAESEVTTYGYDLPGRLTQIFYPTRPADAFVTNTYDAFDRIATQSDANNKTYQYAFADYRSAETDPLGNTRVWYFNGDDQVIRSIDAVGNETAMVYDGQMRLTATVYPEGNSLTMTYDSDHNPLSATRSAKPGSGLADTGLTFTVTAPYNRLKTATDPLGRVTTYFYDANGNLERVEQPMVGGQTPATVYTYNASGQMLTKTDPEGAVTRFTYDAGTGNCLSQIVDDGGLNLTTGYGYDAVGNVTSLTDPKGKTTTFNYDALRRMTWREGPAPLDYRTEFGYDEQGRLTSVSNETDTPGSPQVYTSTYTPTNKVATITDPLGHSITFDYDDADRMLRQTDAESRSKEFRYDAAGHRTQILDSSLVVVEAYAYTANGQVGSTTDGNGNTTVYAYDGFDRLLQTTYPDLSTEVLSYNPTDTIQQKQLRGGQTVTYLYDDLDRRTSQAYPGQTDTYGYDLVGRLTQAANSTDTVTRVYDDAGRLTSVTSGGRTVGLMYDANSNRQRLTFSDSSYVQYTYDELNRMTAIHLNGSTLLASYGYDALSHQTGLTYGNGASLTTGYTADNRVASLAFAWNGDAATLAYDYFDNGMRKGLDVADARFAPVLTTAPVQSYTPNTLNQYSAAGGMNLSYNANGSLTSQDVLSLQYDALNRLTAVPSSGVTYGYDAVGRRSTKTVSSNTTTSVYVQNDVVEEHGPLGMRRIVHGPDVDDPVCMIEPGGATYYFHATENGSIVALSNSAGQVVETYAYTPFGETFIHGSPSGVPVSPYLFAGRSFDVDTGLYYFRARDYHPALGRFLQPDPADYADGPNLYAYVQNNPVNFVDPYGLWTLQIGVSVGGGLGGGGTGGGGVVFGFSWENGFQFGTYEVAGGGGFAGAAGSGVIDISVSSNSDINDLSGNALTVGGSGGEGLSLGGEANFPQGGEAANSYTFSFGVGGGTPLEGHAFVTHTWIQDWTGDK